MNDDFNSRTLRILVDLQACQTQGSALRGVGRYSSLLFSHLFKRNDYLDCFLLLSELFPDPPLIRNLDESKRVSLPVMPEWNSKRDFRGGEQDALDSIMYSSFIAPYKADIIHLSHVFEGYVERVPLPGLSQKVPGQIYSATLYDFIPLLFQEHYFQDENFRKWYFHRIAWLRNADLLLSISESTRKDAIDLLGIEPSKIVTIGGGIAPHFRIPKNRKVIRQRIQRKYSLRDRFVLFTSGDDFRKNLLGAIQGFSHVSSDLRENCQLVIVCEISERRKEELLHAAQAIGLSPNHIIFTGFVPDEDLIELYQSCELFIFPSLYEGLGLPILEAMACGVPVIGGDNSSIQEIINRQDALFDSKSPETIGDLITKCLQTPEFRRSLIETGKSIVQLYTWESSAEKATQAFWKAAEDGRNSGIHFSTSGWLPRKRMAVFSPLPPCQSGIADYNSQFLPFLAKYFEIDLYVDNYRVENDSLSSAFRIFNTADFEQSANQYEVILYEIGNSEFHIHMIPLIEKYPGIVGLHDAYLSGMYAYMDFNQGQTGLYQQAMLESHDGATRRFFAPVKNNSDPVGETIIKFPCTKPIIDKAIGIISHSPFNLKLAKEFYPQGWQGPYRIIPQMIAIPPRWNQTTINCVRESLGFSKDDYLITTFGHVAWTKCGDRLLSAFINSLLSKKENIHLVFAGKLAEDKFGETLEKKIKRSGLQDRIHITGYLTAEEFEQYLFVSDFAVQLRTNSRGGTPKGVLDCLSHGLPVVVNDDASYKDYPDDVVIKLSSNPTEDEIVDCLESFYLDPKKRDFFVNSGKAYVKEKHDPNYCAAAYAAAINEFVEFQKKTNTKTSIPSLVHHLTGCEDNHIAAENAVTWLKNIPMPKFNKPKLLIDVSYIANEDNNTGIPRVVKEIISHLYFMEGMNYSPLAVKLEANELVPAIDWLQSRGLLIDIEYETQIHKQPVELSRGDSLLLLDSSWAKYEEFFPVFSKARSKNIPIYTVVYDLLPIVLPPGNIVDGGKEWFEGWLKHAIQQSDGLICISEAVAMELRDYLYKNVRLPWPKIGFWHLGADFKVFDKEENTKGKVFRLPKTPYLLTVGTIEPRKNHSLMLDAMEEIWIKNQDLNLCIVGKEGWMAEKTMTRIQNHPMLNEKLFFFERIDDLGLQELYSNAAGLIFLSKGEGFGLPLIEAAHYDIPILCSDIPVFREIASEYAEYVKIDSVLSVIEGLSNWLKKKQEGKLLSTKLMPKLSWEESVKMLLEVIIENNWMEES